MQLLVYFTQLCGHKLAYEADFNERLKFPPELVALVGDLLVLKAFHD